jgi:hypothetical protein
MNAAAVTWKLLRIARWALWIAFFGFCFYVHAYHEALVNQFGHLSIVIELTIFGLANAAVFVGLLEMMMRKRAGIPRPSYGSLNRLSSRRSVQLGRLGRRGERAVK